MTWYNTKITNESTLNVKIFETSAKYASEEKKSQIVQSKPSFCWRVVNQTLMLCKTIVLINNKFQKNCSDLVRESVNWNFWRKINYEFCQCDIFGTVTIHSDVLLSFNRTRSFWFPIMTGSPIFLIIEHPYWRL